MLRYLKRFGYILSAFLLIYIVYMISVILLRFGFHGTASQIFFVALGLYLALPTIKYCKDKNEYEVNSLEYCNNMTKVLNGLDKDITRLQGVNLKIDKEVYEIDDIVFTTKGVFNIVECDLKGDILIEDGDRWYKKTRKGYDIITSPVNKIKKNREALREVFKDDQIIDIIAMVNSRVDVDGEEESAVNILRYDDVVDYINDYNEKERYDPEELYDMLYPFIDGEKDLVDIKEKYNIILDNKWKFRSRLVFISMFFILYIFKVMEVG